MSLGTVLLDEILPKFGINVECRLAKFDKETGKLDLEHLKSLVDKKTKLVCCTGASNFLGTKNPIKEIRKIADASGYKQPTGENKSYLLIDGAQTVPNTYINVKELDVDFLAWFFHKMISPFGVGALYAKEELLKNMRPFLYGGDMIADGMVTPEKVSYNSALEVYGRYAQHFGNHIVRPRIAIAHGFFVKQERIFMTGKALDLSDVKTAMDNIEAHETALVGEAMEIC